MRHRKARILPSDGGLRKRPTQRRGSLRRCVQTPRVAKGAAFASRGEGGGIETALDWSGKKVVVTGGAGFIGSHVVDGLVARGATVTIIDDFSTGFREFVSAATAVRLVEGSLLDQPLLDRTLAGIDFVFHLAANADVKDGLLHPRKDVEQNVLATHNLLEAMRANGVKAIAFSSTGSVYGESEVIPTPEDAPFPVQTSLYGASKLASEGLLSAYAWGYGYSVYIFRFVSMLGPRYTHGHIIDFWRKLRNDPTQLEVLGDGHQRKSYLHVKDCVDAILLTIDRSKSDTGIHIHNIGHSDWIEVNDSVRIITREMGLSPKIHYTGGIRGWIGDSPKILLLASRLRALGWAPKRSIEESIVETLRFLVANPYCDRRR
jgi:UDP-glucose 4-epimerase